jgi:hypothetical protein
VRFTSVQGLPLTDTLENTASLPFTIKEYVAFGDIATLSTGDEDAIKAKVRFALASVGAEATVQELDEGWHCYAGDISRKHDLPRIHPTPPAVPRLVIEEEKKQKNQVAQAAMDGDKGSDEKTDGTSSAVPSADESSGSKPEEEDEEVPSKEGQSDDLPALPIVVANVPSSSDRLDSTNLSAETGSHGSSPVEDWAKLDKKEGKQAWHRVTTYRMSKATIEYPQHEPESRPLSGGQVSVRPP